MGRDSSSIVIIFLVHPDIWVVFVDYQRGFEEGNISILDTIAQIWNGLRLVYRQNLPAALYQPVLWLSILNNLVPQILDSYAWMKSTLKLDYTIGQSTCLAHCRQMGICSTCALNHVDIPNWCKGSAFPKALCSPLAELVLFWLGTGVEQGQVWAALLLCSAPCWTWGRANLSRRISICAPFSTYILQAVGFQSSCWHPQLFSLHMKYWMWAVSINVPKLSKAKHGWTVLSSMLVCFQRGKEKRKANSGFVSWRVKIKAEEAEIKSLGMTGRETVGENSLKIQLGIFF